MPTVELSSAALGRVGGRHQLQTRGVRRPFARVMLVGAVALCSIGLVGLGATAFAQDAASTQAFTGNAAAGGVRVTVNIPGFAATDTPVDSGGPTAQVAVDSLGTSDGYAAFPDPGQFVVSLPGLASGLVKGGVAGLPGIPIPSLPDYPFYVTTDPSNPVASLGSGIAKLSSSSGDRRAEASATVGLDAAGLASLGLVTSNASVKVEGGTVTATSTSDVQGLTIGPITIGTIRSVATMKMDSSGGTTPSNHLEVGGLRIGGILVGLTPDGFTVGNQVIPAALNRTLQSLLSGLGLTIEVTKPQIYPDRVVAPAVRITYAFDQPVTIPSVGSLKGTATVILGSATAQLSGATGGTDGTVVDSDGTGSSGSGNEGAFLPETGAVGPALGDLGSATAPPASTTPAAVASSPLPPVKPAVAVRQLQVDTRSLYLLVLLGGILSFAVSTVIRRMEVHE